MCVPTNVAETADAMNDALNAIIKSEGFSPKSKSCGCRQGQAMHLLVYSAPYGLQSTSVCVILFNLHDTPSRWEWFNHLINRYLLSTFYGPDTDLLTEQGTNQALTFMKHTF